MATYEITENSYINDRLVQEGEKITVNDDVIPGTHWKPLDAAAKTACKAAGFSTVSSASDALKEAGLAIPMQEDPETGSAS